MKCKTTTYGGECTNDAEFVVSGPYTKEHPCCKIHLKMWQDSYIYPRVESLTLDQWIEDRLRERNASTSATKTDAR